MEKRINGEIFGYVMQIFAIIVFVVVSYFAFTNSRLSQFASMAAKYSRMDSGLSVSYSKDTNSVLATADLLDKGTLSIKNPNKIGTSSIVYLYVSEDAKLDNVEFVIDGNTIDTTDAKVKDGYYILPVLNCELDAYENKLIDAEIKGNPYYITSFSYKFDVVSF